MFTRYNVEIELLTPMLGTNALNPQVRQKHIIQKQNELIEKFNKSKSKGEMSKYNNAKPISDEAAKEEIDATFRKLEEYLGRELSDEDKALVLDDPKKFFKETKEDEPSGITGFFYDKERCLPYIRGYMVHGFLKAAGEVFARIAETQSRKGKKGEWLSSISQTKSFINQYVSIDRDIYFSQDIVRNEDGTPSFYERPIRVSTPQGPRVALTSSERVEAGATMSFQIKVLEGVIVGDDIKELLQYGEMKGLGQFRNGDHGQFKLIKFEKV